MAATLAVCAQQDLTAGATRVVTDGDLEILVANCAGVVYAVENQCSHEDAPLDEGTLDQRACTIECPRHGSVFDLRSGRPLSLPAYEPIETFPVRVVDGEISLEVQ